MTTRSFPRLRATYRLLYESAEAWVDDRALRLGAGVAYYGLFALVPVLFLSMVIATILLGRTVGEDVEEALQDIFGPDLAEAVIGAIESLGETASEWSLSLIGIAALMFTATLLFVAWKEVVDLLWGIPRERGVRATVRRRLFGVFAVLGSGALLTLSLASQAFINWIEAFLSRPAFGFLLGAAGSVTLFFLGVVFVGVLFKYTPDAEVAWSSVWFGSAVSMGILTIGAWGYGIYLDLYGFSSAAGVAGTVFLGLAFVYMSVAILLYGVVIVRRVHEDSGFVPLAYKPPSSDKT